MDLKLGEFVRFVDERYEGYITRIIDEQMIGVTGEDDFEIPVPANKVTRVHGHVYKGIENQAQAEEVITGGEFKASGIFLAVIPDLSKSSVVSFYLINETSFQLVTTLNVEKDKLVKGIFAGIIAPQSTSRIFSASLTEINNWPKFHIQALFYTAAETAAKQPLIYEQKFGAKHFSGAKKEAAILKQQGWIFRVDDEDLVVDPEKLKESFFKPAEEKKQIDKPLKEVDLHIEKLRDDYEFLSKREILKIQLEHFQKMLDAALVHKLPSIVFIHGVGNGTLRYEIQKVVSKHPQVKTYKDAHKDRFGYGATEVIFK